MPKVKLDPLGIDSFKAEKILGAVDDADEEHQVYTEEHVEYLPARRPSQVILAFDSSQANTVHKIFMLFCKLFLSIFYAIFAEFTHTCTKTML